MYEVFLKDPPGVWTPERLLNWCNTLARTRNARRWGLRLLPTYLERGTISAMLRCHCRHVEFLFPSPDPQAAKAYGCEISLRHLRQVITRLQHHRINVTACFWLGGPDTPSREGARIVRTLRELGHFDYVLEPFPLEFDAPAYRAAEGHPLRPALEDWIHWAKNPWQVDRPVAVWGGRRQALVLAREFASIHARVQRHPIKILRALQSGLPLRSWIHELESRTAEWFQASLAHRRR